MFLKEHLKVTVTFNLDDLHTLFHSLVMSLFTYAIQVWCVASYSKYLINIDSLQNIVFKFGYIKSTIPISRLKRNYEGKSKSINMRVEFCDKIFQSKGSECR